MSIRDIIKNRILVLDGAMGTMIQSYGLTEDDFRGQRFADSNVEMKAVESCGESLFSLSVVACLHQLLSESQVCKAVGLVISYSVVVGRVSFLMLGSLYAFMPYSRDLLRS